MNTIKNNPVINFYNSLAGDYDAEQNDPKFQFVRVPEKELLLESFKHNLSKDFEVLEIGAGTGRFTIEIAKQVKNITALDISANMLEILKDKMKSENLNNISTINDDFLNHHFDWQYDAIVAFSSIEYIKDKDALFKKISELLKPGGTIIITTAHDTFFRLFGRMGNYFRQKILMNAFKKKEIHKIFKDNSLKVITIEDLVMKNFILKGILLYIYAKKSQNE